MSDSLIFHFAYIFGTRGRSLIVTLLYFRLAWEVPGFQIFCWELEDEGLAKEMTKDLGQGLFLVASKF